MNRLKELRKRRFTQMEIASRLGVSRSTYTKYETGAIQLSEEILQKLADLYQVSVDYILGRTNVLSPDPSQALSETEFALNGELRDLTDAEKRDVLAYVRFRKLQKK